MDLGKLETDQNAKRKETRESFVLYSDSNDKEILNALEGFVFSCLQKKS